MNITFLKNKKIIALAIALVALLAVFLIIEYAIPSSKQKPGQNDDNTISDSSGNSEYSETPIGITELYNSVPEFAASSVSHHETLTDINAKINGEKFSFKKVDGTWKYIDNANVETSHFEVSKLTVNLFSLSYSDKINAGEVLPSDCGIDENSDYIKFTNTYGVEAVYTLGNDIPGSDMKYLMTSFSDDIYMVKNKEIDSIFKPFEVYRIDNLQTVDFDNIVKIYFKNQNTELLLEKGTPDMNNGIYYEWRMISPYSIFARDDMVKSLFLVPVASFEGLVSASDRGDFGNYGLASKENKIIFEDINGKTQTVYFSNLMENRYYLSIDDKPNIYELYSQDAPFAEISTIDVADRALYLVNRDNISKVTVSGENYDYNIVFNDDLTIEINGKKISDKESTSDIFKNLVGLYADDMASVCEGVKEFEMAFELKNSQKIVLEFFRNGERYFTVSKNGTPIYKILRSKTDKLIQNLNSYIVE